MTRTVRICLCVFSKKDNDNYFRETEVDNEGYCKHCGDYAPHVSIEHSLYNKNAVYVYTDGSYYMIEGDCKKHGKKEEKAGLVRSKNGNHSKIKSGKHFKNVMAKKQGKGCCIEEGHVHLPDLQTEEIFQKWFEASCPSFEADDEID